MIVECTFTGKDTDEVCLRSGEGDKKCPHFEPHEHEWGKCLDKYQADVCSCVQTFRCVMLEAINEIGKNVGKK